MLKTMSLDEKLGQLLIVEYTGTLYDNTALPDMISQQYVGGLLYQPVNHNFDEPNNTASAISMLSQKAQKDAKIPLIISIDQEGGGDLANKGGVNKLETIFGATQNATDMGLTGDPQVAAKAGSQSADWMKQLGINTDLAPVVDVQTINPPPDWLATRMFGTDPDTVIKFAGPFIDGLQQNGIIGCLKHFPGLGAAVGNPHKVLPKVDRTKDDLEKIDLAPYKALLQQTNPAMIMTTDVNMPALDAGVPAELSPKVVDGLLRKELGYSGVIITDGLYMEGLYDNGYGPHSPSVAELSQIAVKAVMAGNDLLEGPYTVDQVQGIINALEKAISTGKLTEDRINQSVMRILTLKMDYGIIK
ncbi:glycoside hydrolase family 3 protein [Tengunoibacter tsumagoiensis]|nr:glycoside hydrolase family 3 N-terminal domain-containing protein [Tengunoibacter tsumagoiensis]